MNALKDVSAPVAAIIYSAEPLWGAGLAYCLLGERCAAFRSGLHYIKRLHVAAWRFESSACVQSATESGVDFG